MSYYNTEAEQIVIGTCIMNNEHFAKVEDFLETKHFYHPEHRAIWQHFISVASSVGVANQITLKDFFANNQEIKKVGGVEYLSTLLTSASMLVPLKTYGLIIFNLWQKRELFNSLESIDKSMTLEQIKNDLIEKLDTLELKNETEPKLINDLMKDFIARKVENKEIGELINLEYPLLDKILGGLYYGNLVVLAGKASMGKTAFSLNIAKRISQKAATYLVSIEMTNDEVLGRFLVEQASISGYRLRKAELRPIEEQGVMIEKDKFKQMLYIDDTSGIGLAVLGSKIKKMVKKGVKVVIIDYLQKIIPSNTKESRERQIGGIIEGLKDMAKKLKIVMIVLCQLSRENEKRPNKRPLLSDLRDSGSIEQESDVVMFVHRDDYYLEKEAEPTHSPNYSRWLEAYNNSKGKAYILVSKNRNGETGESQMFFDKQFQRFTETNF